MSWLTTLKNTLGGAGAAGATRPSPTSRVMTIPSQPPVVVYVKALLLDVIIHQKTIVIRTSEPLPVLAGAPPPPGVEQVINRLKFLAGLNPVPYPHPVTKSFTFDQSGHEREVTAVFNDQRPSPSCQLSVKR